MVKRKDGRWQEKVVFNGKPHYFYGSSKAEVLRKVNAFREKEKNGPTFEQVADLWWRDHEPTLQHNTIKSYTPAMDRAVAALGSMYINTITPPMVKAEIRKMAKSFSDKTVRTQLMIYNLIFKFAVSEGLIPYNPARELSVPANLPKRKVSAPSSEDIAKVKSSVGCTFGLFAYMALYTGLRRGELLALEWGDVDLQGRTIVVNKSLEHVANKPRVKSTKTAKGNRIVPILDALLPHLKKQGKLVFSNSEGSYITETQFQRLWELYTKESGVTCTPHQLRHAFATMLFENGIKEKDAMSILGHAQLSTTMDIYTDIREQHQRKVFEHLYGVDLE